MLPTINSKTNTEKIDMAFIQGILDSLFAVGVGIVVGVLACKLGIVDWAMGLFIKK